MLRPFALLVAALAALALAASPVSAQTAAPAAPPACAAPPCTAPITSSQVPNLGQIKDEIKTYYMSGSYAAEVESIEADAQHYLDLRAHAVKRPALVLDIDDTSVLTYGYESTHDFGFDPDTWSAAATAGFPPVDATLALAKHAAAENIAVIFVTGRRTPQRDFTRKNLVDDGYPISGLYLRPVDDHAASVVPYKSSARADIEAQGYTILETIGDQWSDLLGGHAERAYKLPNPMYFIP
jgi:predicted secreted acid phosphatase